MNSRENTLNFFQNLKSNEKIEFIINVYEILIENGASTEELLSFTHYMINDINESKEWRFQGKLGYGGKYYFPENKIDCYQEDYIQCKSLIEIANTRLQSLVN